MIINIRGTSGSGKSHLVRLIMARYHQRIRIMEDGRKQPIMYLLNRNEETVGKPLIVIGHYESDCGGCDTISKMDKIFDLVRQAHKQKADVIFEGLLISADVNRVGALHEESLPLTVMAIDLPIDECLSSVNGRRRAKAERTSKEYKGDVNPKNTISKHKGVQQSMKRLRNRGVDTRWGTRDEVFEMLKRELDI